MANALGVIVGQKEVGGQYMTDKTNYVGFNYSDWYPVAVKFTTPSFVGTSASVTFSLGLKRGPRNGTSSAVLDLRYALCTSDENLTKYDKTTAVVSDANQITAGTVTFSELTSTYTGKNLTIQTTQLKGNTTYYLILWGNNSGGYQQDYGTLSAANAHSLSVEYSSGLGYIGGAAYTVHIGNGSGFDMYIPYVGNGKDWEICS